MRTSAPTWSSEGASGSTPSVGTEPKVGLCPTSPQNAAGSRIEQPVSVPSASGVIPAATAAADPPLDPPGMRERSHGLRVPPSTGCCVVSPHANSWVRVLPTTMAPASRSRATAVASRRAGGSGGTRGAGPGDRAGDVEQVLDGEGHAGERPGPIPGAQVATQAFGRTPGTLGVHLDERADVAVDLGDAVQRRLDHLDGIPPPGPDVGRGRAHVRRAGGDPAERSAAHRLMPPRAAA